MHLLTTCWLPVHSGLISIVLSSPKAYLKAKITTHALKKCYVASDQWRCGAFFEEITSIWVSIITERDSKRLMNVALFHILRLVKSEFTTAFWIKRSSSETCLKSHLFDKKTSETFTPSDQSSKGLGHFYGMLNLIGDVGGF